MTEMPNSLSGLFGEPNKSSLHKSERLCWNCGKKGAKRSEPWSTKSFCDQECEDAWYKKQEYEKKAKELTRDELMKIIHSKNVEIKQELEINEGLGNRLRERNHKWKFMYNEKANEYFEFKKKLEIISAV